MERRRTDRRKELEMVLASIFLAAKAFHNTCSYRTSESTYPPNNLKDLGAVNGPKVTDSALTGHWIYLVSSGGPVAQVESKKIVSPARETPGPEAVFPSNRTAAPLESSICGNPVNRIPANRTKTIESGHDLFFALLFRAVEQQVGGVLLYLERAELKESDKWLQQDLRLAQQIVLLAQEGQGNPYSKAFRQLFHKNAHEVRFWWRDRQKLLRLSQYTNCPTPLLVANRAEEALNVIPDFDYAEVGHVGTALGKRNVSLGKAKHRAAGAD